MKICITGSEGFVGSYVAKELREHEIIPFDLKLGNDCTDISQCAAAFRGGGEIDAVIHTAAIATPAYDPPEKVFAVNTISTFNVHEAAFQCGVKKVVFISSEAVYGFFFNKDLKPMYRPIDELHPLRPADPYGLSKKVGEAISEAYADRMVTCSLRPSAIMKPEIENHEKYKKLLSTGGFPDDRNTYGYVDVRDLAKACRITLENDMYGSFNVNTVSVARDLAPWISSQKLREFGWMPEVTQ